MRGWFVLCLAVLAGCGDVNTHQAALIRPPVDRPTMAGIGDVVLEMKLTQPLPNAFGRADVFGRTRDTGRIVVVYLGAERGDAIFARRNVDIYSNETTMSRSPMVIPTVQTTETSGAIGPYPVYGTQTTTGATVIPAQSSSTLISQAGQYALRIPAGGSAIVEGRRLTVRQIFESGVEYTVR